MKKKPHQLSKVKKCGMIRKIKGVCRGSSSGSYYNYFDICDFEMTVVHLNVCIHYVASKMRLALMKHSSLILWS